MRSGENRGTREEECMGCGRRFQSQTLMKGTMPIDLLEMTGFNQQGAKGVSRRV